MVEKERSLKLQDEGSWALMIEESNARAILNRHGNMACLQIDYYLSVGKNRWYKAYFDETEILNNRKNMIAFLKDDERYNQCLSEIEAIMLRMKKINAEYEGLDLIGKYRLYCKVLCDYIAYYNSVIADTFYQEIYEFVDSSIPQSLSFAANMIKDSLFATNNNELLSHTQNVDIVRISEKYINGEDITEDVKEYVRKYKSTTASSGNPNGITSDEVIRLVEEKTSEEVETEKSFFDNLKMRYDNVDYWSDKTADSIGLDADSKKIIRRTSQLSYIKILMREVFQDFKIATRENFLNRLIAEIGKKTYDYMLIQEIESYILTGTKISTEIIEKRKAQIIFEVDGDKFNVIDSLPDYVKIEEKKSKSILVGDVLIGSGIKRYRVREIEQNEEGLIDFNEYLESEKEKENVALITNVMRPFLVPKLKKFGAIITQYGGYTSHASVLCREMGINSIISVDDLMDSLSTGDYIEIDFNKGKITKVSGIEMQKDEVSGVGIDLKTSGNYDKSDLGNKAYNLMRINELVNTPKGFVVTNNAMKNIDDLEIQEEIMQRIAALNCKKLAIRSSHESEDGDNSSCAGLFESYVNIDSKDKNEILKCIKGVYNSQFADHLDKYGVNKEGDMHVIIQEMIEADVSGVMLTSSPYHGVDYLLIEYVVGDLCHIMQGDVTPLSSYVKKEDILNGVISYKCYPEIITNELKNQFSELIADALKLEKEYMHRVEIEWGIKEGEIYIFQVRTY